MRSNTLKYINDDEEEEDKGEELIPANMGLTLSQIQEMNDYVQKGLTKRRTK